MSPARPVRLQVAGWRQLVVWTTNRRAGRCRSREKQERNAGPPRQEPFRRSHRKPRRRSSRALDRTQAIEADRDAVIDSRKAAFVRDELSAAELGPQVETPT